MPAETRSVAVVGAGVMGAEIALVAAQSGFDVVLRDVDRAAIDRGIAHATRTGERQVAKGRASAEDLAAALARIAPAEDDGALAGCAVAIEVVPENLEIKRGVFARLDAALPPGALIASNTSGLSITALGGFTGRPERVVGLHFFNPPSVMRLVEVVRGERTSAETVEEGLALVRAMGKTPVPVAECPGFLVNRVLVRAMVGAYRAAAASGADPAAVDAAVAASGPAPMGPYALGDLIGLDTLASIGADLVAAYGERFSDGGVLAPLVAAGRLGRKSGGGFFDGPPPGDARAHGPEATAAAAAYGERFSDGGVLAPLVAAGRLGRKSGGGFFDGPSPGDPGAPGPDAMAAAAAYYDGARDEARRCRDEGVAAPDDIDVALRLGAGWSAGPLESAA